MSLFDTDGYEVCSICKGRGMVYDHKLGVDRMCECQIEKLQPPDTNPAGPAGIYDRADEIRLNKQQAAVWAVMRDGEWHTMREISRRTDYPEASISARFRDLRKPKYGGHTVEREHLGDGLHRYRLIPSNAVMVVP
jgi:hypothetical protein